jgi:hypothetical protein
MKFKAPSHVTEIDPLDLAQQTDVAKIRVIVVVHIEVETSNLRKCQGG